MAKVMIGHHPELTAESAMKVFQRQFTDKYELYMTRMPRIAFFVKQSASRGVSVKLKQKRGQTYFEFMETTPSPALTILAMLLWAGWFILGLYGLSKSGGIGGFIGFLLWIALGLWLLRLPFSRPSRKIEKEVTVLIEKTEEFKGPSES